MASAPAIRAFYGVLQPLSRVSCCYAGYPMADEQQSLSGPHLQIAAFCEKVLLEADQTASLIRVVDRFTVTGPTPEMAPAVITFFLVVSFKSGFIRGKHTIKIVPVSPTGVELPAMEAPQLFEGEDRGAMIALQLNFLVQEEGLYWFRVYFENALVTQMPLRVIYQRVAFAGQVPAAG